MSDVANGRFTCKVQLDWCTAHDVFHRFAAELYEEGHDHVVVTERLAELSSEFRRVMVEALLPDGSRRWISMPDSIHFELQGMFPVSA